MPTDEWFGPGRALSPMAPPSTRGRQWDFQFGQNMQIRPRWDTQISFRHLRALADGHDLTRLAIETRKDQMSRLKWTFGVLDSEDDLTDEQQARASRYRAMLRRPDGENFWADWLRMVLEDLLVIDAPTVFIRRTMDREDVLGLFQIDGSTIMPLIDNLGRTPAYPEPAFQQVLHGMPAVDYTSRDMVYRPRNRRIHTIWGYSPVEQIIATINIALRRQLWQHAYFTNGNIPDSLIGVPGTWSPGQIAEFQTWFDALLTGNTEKRRGAIFVPGEVAKSYVPTKDAEMFGAAEEWLARVVCYCFGLSHQALVKEVNRSTSDNAREQALLDGLAPVMGWVKSLMDGILIDHLGEEELEFRWVDDKELDPKVQDEIWAGRVERGAASKNEWRGAVGMEPRPEPEANMLTTNTAQTPTPISVKDEAMISDARVKAGIKPDPAEVPPAVPGQQPVAGPKTPKNPSSGEAVVAPEGPDGGAASKAAPPSTRPPRLAVTRRSLARPRQRLQSVIQRGLARVGARVVAAVEQRLTALGKSEADDLEATIQEALAALGSWTFMIDATAEELETIAEDTVREAVAMLGSAAPDGLVDQVSDRAVADARVRAAELVGKRILQNGDIVDNPDARWAISDSTRDMVRDTITRVLRENEGSDAIIQSLQDDYAFSPARAEMVSRTEVAGVNSRAAMETYREARTAGVSVKKEWILGPEPCEICQENADAGPIDLDEDFPSGDSEPGAHPYCECAVTPVVEDGAAEAEEGGEDDAG